LFNANIASLLPSGFCLVTIIGILVITPVDSPFPF